MVHPSRLFRWSLILTLLVIFSTTASKAQKTWIQPADHSFSDTVTIFIDIKKVNKKILQGQEEIYLWSMLPNEPVIGNGAWPESNEAMLMTHEGDDVWSYRMVPTDFYGIDSAAFMEQGWWVHVKVKSPVMTFESEMLKSEDLGLIPKQVNVMMPTDSLHTTKLTVIKHHQLLMTDIKNHRSLYHDPTGQLGIGQAIDLFEVQKFDPPHAANYEFTNKSRIWATFKGTNNTAIEQTYDLGTFGWKGAEIYIVDTLGRREHAAINRYTGIDYLSSFSLTLGPGETKRVFSKIPYDNRFFVLPTGIFTQLDLEHEQYELG